MKLRGRRIPRTALAFWALAGVAQLVSHDLIWMVQMGPGERLATALRGAGHGYWGAASTALAVVGLVTLLAVIARLIGLRRRAGDLGASVAPGPARSYRRRVLGAWLRLVAVVAIGFVIQENVEHALSHHHVPGIGILAGPEYPLALPVIAAITALGALLAGAVTTVAHRLVAAIEAAMRLSRRAPIHTGWRSTLIDRRRPPSPLATASAMRAPPRVLLAA